MNLTNYYNILQEKQKEIDKQYFIEKYPLYVDMDGVLVDFKSAFSKIPQETLEKYKDNKSRINTSYQSSNIDNFLNFINIIQILYIKYYL